MGGGKFFPMTILIVVSGQRKYSETTISLRLPGRNDMQGWSESTRDMAGRTY
jgi:hypothetical protein